MLVVVTMYGALVGRDERWIPSPDIRVRPATLDELAALPLAPLEDSD